MIIVGFLLIVGGFTNLLVNLNIHKRYKSKTFLYIFSREGIWSLSSNLISVSLLLQFYWSVYFNKRYENYSLYFIEIILYTFFWNESLYSFYCLFLRNKDLPSYVIKFLILRVVLLNIS